MEDLSEIAAGLSSEYPKAVPLPNRIGPAVGVFKSLPPDVRQALETMADEIERIMDDAPRKAAAYIRERSLSQEELVGLWTLLPSVHRTALRKAGL